MPCPTEQHTHRTSQTCIRETSGPRMLYTHPNSNAQSYSQPPHATICLLTCQCTSIIHVGRDLPTMYHVLFSEVSGHQTIPPLCHAFDHCPRQARLPGSRQATSHTRRWVGGAGKGESVWLNVRPVMPEFIQNILVASLIVVAMVK